MPAADLVLCMRPRNVPTALLAVSLTTLGGSYAASLAALLDRSDAFVTTAAEKLLTYALGRRLEYYDMPAVRAIVRQAGADDYRFSALVLGVARSEPFRTQVKGAAE